MSKLQGVYVVMTTPFHQDGAFDFDGIARNIEYYIENGVHGILIAGATGEFGVMTIAERKELAAFVLDKIGGRVPAVVGAVTSRAEDTIEIAKHATAHGADGVMVLTPPYAGLDEEEVYNFFKQVNDNINTSIMVYNNPSSCGFDIEIDLLARIAELEHVDCIKESTGDIKRISLIKDTLGDEIGIFAGWEDMAWESFMAGATGWVSVIANFAPRMSVELFNRTTAEKGAAAGWEVYRKLLPALRNLESGKLIQAAKCFQNSRNLNGGHVRSPRLPLNADQEQEVRRVIDETGIN